MAYETLENIINHIMDMNGRSSDIVSRIIKIGNKRICYIYLESVSSDDKVSDFFMKYIDSRIKDSKIDYNSSSLFDNLINSIPNSHILTSKSYDDIFYKLTSGYTCIFVEGKKEAITIETRMSLDRGITESTSEAIIRGPKDSFTENHQINIGLIRKRIKDPNLIFYDMNIGRRTKTKVTISYIDDVCNKRILNRLKKNLKKIDIDGILDSGYIREFLTKNQTSSFPKLLSTERPDLACQFLLEGRLVVLVENTPFVLIIPSLFIDFMHSSEDNYQKYLNVNLTRVIRFFAFFLAILLPGLYVALTTYNQEIIPNELLISLATGRDGVPFPTAIEMFVMIVTFEILRESDVRIANVSGTSIGIVGALVLGDAAVSAGIVSPIVIIVVGLTSVSSLLFTDIDFVNGIRLWKLVFLFSGTFLGIIGFTFCMLIFITRLCSLEYDDVPYLFPLAPTYNCDNAIFRKPRYKMFYRLNFISRNRRKMGDSDET